MTRHVPPETLGQRIARLRAHYGWTQQQLAERLAASRVAVSHFEMGLAMPSERTIVLLAGLFKIEPPQLIEDTGYPEAKADKLPATVLRYTETEFQLALLERDLHWLTPGQAATSNQVLAEWHTRLTMLLAKSVDTGEQAALTAALEKLRTLSLE